MDEPFGALDAQTRALLQDELLRIIETRDLMTLFVTHDLEEAIYLSDQVVIMTHRPGTVKEVVEVELGGRRYESDVRGTAHFNDLRRHAWSSLREELVRAGV